MGGVWILGLFTQARVSLSAQVNPSTNNFLLAFPRLPGQPLHLNPRLVTVKYTSLV